MCKNTYFPVRPMTPKKIRSSGQGCLQEFHGSPSLSALLLSSGMSELTEKETGSLGAISSPSPQLCLTEPCTLEANKLFYPASCVQDITTRLSLINETAWIAQHSACTVTSRPLPHKTPVHHRPLPILSFHWRKCR